MNVLVELTKDLAVEKLLVSSTTNQHPVAKNSNTLDAEAQETTIQQKNPVNTVVLQTTFLTANFVIVDNLTQMQAVKL